MESEEEKEIKKAEHAKNLLKDPLLQEVLDKMEEEYTVTWRNTKTDETEARELLWQLLWAIGEFRSHLSVIMQRGEFHKGYLQKSIKRKH